MKRVILIFAKNLNYGEVKTRLAATVGNNVAFSVYRQLLAHTHTITKDMPSDKTVFYSNNIEENDIWDNKNFKRHLQSGNGLGERMKNAFDHAFDEEYEQAIIIGTDCFELSSKIITEAFDRLKKHDIVIGPATDGGYYLLGMKKLHSQLFLNISWSTVNVLQQTIAICRKENLAYYQLQELSDIDDEIDLLKTNFSYQ